MQVTFQFVARDTVSRAFYDFYRTEENKSLWQRIYDATVGLIKKILAFKDMLLNVLARAAAAIGTIIAHPIAFLGHLVDAGKLGFSNFADHIVEHLKAGFTTPKAEDQI